MEYKTLAAEHFHNMENLLESEESYDVKIRVGEKSDVKEIHAHSPILLAQCPFFNDVLANATKEKNYYIIEKPNFNEFVLKKILEFLYACKIELDGCNGQDIFSLLIAIDELGLESFYKYTMDYFIKKNQDFINENQIKILRRIYTNEKFCDLKAVCLQKICVDSGKLFQSDEFELLEKPILLEILQRNDFIVNEIEVWENLLKWGLAKHPEINGNEQWGLQNSAKLGKTLKDFISLIRFKDISRKDFYNKIEPYQDIFPKAVWKDILHDYVLYDEKPIFDSSSLPSRKPDIADSHTIDRRHTLLFASWIDRKSPTYQSVGDVKYEFKLLYCSSRDGLDEGKFHEKCGNNNRTLVVAKIQNSDQLIGGYNPLDWDGDQHKETNESFIFNINRNDINSALHSYVVNDNKQAIYCNPSDLPGFGAGKDLIFNKDGKIGVSVNTYNNINIINESMIDDLEVFQING